MTDLTDTNNISIRICSRCKKLLENDDIKELSFCLIGEGTKINAWYPGNITESSWGSLSVACSWTDIEHLHSHPAHDCHLSSPDIENTDENFSVGVICDTNKFSFYRNGNLMNVERIEINNSLTDITQPKNETDIGICTMCYGSCYPPCKDSTMIWYCDDEAKKAFCSPQ